MFERGREKPGFIYSELARKTFLKFETRSDDPGEFLSGEEKDKLQEATRTNPEALMKWEEDRNSKYRINSLYAPIAASENFLKSKEADSVPNDVKEELISRIDSAYEDLKKSRGKRIEKKLVDEVKEIVNEVSKYLK
jgi:hypothetical protein